MSNHRMPRRRSPLNRTVGAGVVAGGIALGAVGLLAPATASADISVGGQSDSPGAAGGNMGGSTASNNVFTGGTGSVTVVGQNNGNYTGGDGNTSVHIPLQSTVRPRPRTLGGAASATVLAGRAATWAGPQDPTTWSTSEGSHGCRAEQRKLRGRRQQHVDPHSDNRPPSIDRRLRPRSLGPNKRDTLNRRFTTAVQRRLGHCERTTIMSKRERARMRAMLGLSTCVGFVIVGGAAAWAGFTDGPQGVQPADLRADGVQSAARTTARAPPAATLEIRPTRATAGATTTPS